MKSLRLSSIIIVLVAVLTMLIGCTGQPATPETTKSPPESGIETPPTSEYLAGEPQYTSDLTGSGTASASTEGIAGPPSAAFDNDDSTYWQVSDSDNEWLVYDFGKGNTYIIGKYSITTDSNPVSMPSSFILQGSSDGIKWTALDTRTGVLSAWSVSYTFNNTCHYRYYKLANIRPQANMAQFIIQEIELCSQVSPPELSCPPSISCAELSPPPDEDMIWSEAAGKDIRMEDGTWIWRGFHYEWENTNHKFHDLKCEYYDIKYNFDPATGKSKLSGKLTGQQNYKEPIPVCEDKLNYYTIKRGIKTGVAEFRHATMDEVRVSGNVGEHVEMVFPQHIDMDGLEKYDNVTIFMRGFSFEEYGSLNKSGAGAYPIQCFGLWVGDITGPFDKGYEPGQYLRCNLHVVLHMNGEPNNIFPKPDPWEYSVRYYYTLVGGNDGEFSYTLGDKYYSGEYVGGNKVDCPRAPDKVRETTITGATCYDSGVVAFRGFLITINHDTSNLPISIVYPKRNLGRNIRTLDVAIKWQGYSKQTGRAIFYPDIYLCNKAVYQNAMNTEYEGFFTLLQFQDPDQWDDTLEIIDAGMGKSENVAPEPNWTVGPFYEKLLKSVNFPTP